MPDLSNISLPKTHPNFFILGAAKSGTTSLYHYLKQHPEIFMSEIKEPSFFCETFQQVDNAEEYFGLFDNAEKEKVIGEASHVYMTDPKSPKWLHELFPKAKFLISLRNPAERAFSQYLDMRNHGWESIRTFRDALEKEEERMGSEAFKWNNPQYFYNFLYFHSGLYGQQIQRYLKYFDKHQFMVIRLDDLEKDFEPTIRSILEFLEVDPSFLPQHEVHNKTFKVRSHALQEFLNRVMPESSLKEWMMGHTYHKKPTLDPELKAELMGLYREDQELLLALCGISFN